MNKTKFVMLVGIPGCGKSTYAKSLEERGYVWLSSDNLRNQMGFEQGKGCREVFATMETLTKNALSEGKNVIYDATNLRKGNRAKILNVVSGYEAEKEAVIFTLPLRECIRRNALRTGSARVPEEEIFRLKRGYQSPSYEEGFDKIIVR